MESIVLEAARRTVIGKAAQQLRHDHIIPAVVYGHGIESQNLQIERAKFRLAWKAAGSSSLVDLHIDGGSPIKVLIHAIQRHPTKGDVSHIDFYQVRMTEKLETDIELNFVGESPAVKEHGGILIRTLDKVKVQCLPADLVPAIDVDISTLKSFEDRIHVRDIAAPKGITILENADEVIASVTPPRSEAEIEALSAKVEEDVAAVGTVEKKEKPEEVEEGETPAPVEKK